jgi:hypothetical protein
MRLDGNSAFTYSLKSTEKKMANDRGRFEERSQHSAICAGVKKEEMLMKYTLVCAMLTGGACALSRMKSKVPLT